MMPELRFETIEIPGTDPGPGSPLPDLLGENILQNQLEFCLGEEDEIYEGYGRRENAYPYRQQDTYTRSLEKREIPTAVLENDYLKAVFLPTYCGRLWELWDKTAGRNLLYTNDVLRFSNLAVRNAWFSGGVEWNIGVIGHSPLTIEKLYVAKLQTAKAAPVLRMYEHERIRKVTWQMDFWLEEDDHFLNCRMRIMNENPQVVPMYWWSNIAVPEHEGGRIIVPADKAFTNRDNVVYKTNIPMVNGIDITDYKKIPKSVDFFFEIPAEAPKYIANVDRKGYGLLQMSTSRLRSRKLFSWGNQDASDHWQEFLTEKAGRYVEIQAGLAKTQYGCIPMAPHASWEWMEQYGAVTIPLEDLAADHSQRSCHLTRALLEQGLPDKLEQRLVETKTLAKTPAALVSPGSGYGAMAHRGDASAHLTFIPGEKSLENWQRFFETGLIHCPPAGQRPDEFLINQENLHFLSRHMTANASNWYAYYHLGIGYYLKKDYPAALKALELSCQLAENPWARHALSCTCIRMNRLEDSCRHILKGLEQQSDDISYLKEGFRILSLCHHDSAICSFWASLSPAQQGTGKIKFYYILSLHRLGENEKALSLMEENQGLIIDDIREGEESVQELWLSLYEKVHGCAGQLPHRYNYKAY